MKRVITMISLIMTLGATLFAQLPSFEWRLENEQLVSSKVYSLDVYLYNNGTSSFEVRGGTIAFLLNTAWSNGGTLTVSTPSSGLVAGQQGSTASFVGTGAAYFRKIITTVGSGTGTSIPAGSKVKCFTINLTNTVDFSTTASPNFAWKFNAAPAAGFNYDNAGSNVAVVSNTGTAAVIANQANCYTPTYWNDSAWNTGSKTAGAVSTAAPASSQDLVIYNGVYRPGIGSNLTCRGLNLFKSTGYDLTGHTLQIEGNVILDESIGGSSGNVLLFGTGQNSNQSILSRSITSRYSIYCDNFQFGVLGSTGTKAIKNVIIASRVFIQRGPSSVYFDSSELRLMSNGSATPSTIWELSSGTTITGNTNDYLRVEQFIPANGRRWRFLASPVVGGTTLQWRNNGNDFSGEGIQITGPNGTVDASLSNQTSAYKYNEASANGGSIINAKWEAIDGNTTLTNGKGYRVFVRGDRTISLTTPNSTNNFTTIYVQGTYPSSPVNLPVTYNASLGNGWNLVGNPFPCYIDWNAASGWTKTNISGTIWIWNPITNSYGSFDGLTSINSVEDRISASQAFFVKATGINPSLIATERVKGTTGTFGSLMFKTASKNTLKIILKKDATESDETVIRFMDTKSDEFNGTDDVEKPMMNPAVNISSYFGTDKYAMVNYMNTKSMDAKVIPLGASVAEAGTYDLNFSQVDGFDANINIYLKDNYNNTITDLRQNSKYAFNVDSKPESTMDGRLELIFVNKTSSIESVLAGRTANMNVYPNPAVDVLNVEITNANFKQSEVSIFNVSGVEVMNNNMMGNKKSLDIQKLSSGVYFVRVSNIETGFVNTVKFVK